MPVHTLSARGILVSLDLEVGHIAGLTIERDGRTLSPLHRAPWADEAGLDPNLPPHLRHLSGDFLCAPFGAADLEPAPAHGWPANSAWRHVATESSGGRTTGRFVLDRPVMGATVEKRLTLIDNHPFLYQCHTLTGGAGRIPAGHHTMVRAESGGRLSVSPKRAAITPADWPEPARVLRYPAEEVTDFYSFPGRNAARFDLLSPPLAPRNEDFVMLVEAATDGLGWSAFRRRSENDAVIVLKSTAALPVTMLWYSNGGRAESPWNGRHLGVLGIEDCRAFSLHGHRASAAANPLSEAGIPTAFDLAPGGGVVITQAIGALPLPWSEAGDITALVAANGALQMTQAGGREIAVPFASELMEGAAWQR